MRPNQRVWGFLLVFAGAAPRASVFWKMAPFGGVGRWRCRVPFVVTRVDCWYRTTSRCFHPKGWARMPRSVGVPSAMNSGRNFSKTHSQRPGTPTHQAFSPRPPSSYQRLVLRVDYGDRNGQEAWSLGPVLADKLFPVDGNMNKTPSRNMTRMWPRDRPRRPARRNAWINSTASIPQAIYLKVWVSVVQHAQPEKGRKPPTLRRWFWGWRARRLDFPAHFIVCAVPRVEGGFCLPG